jgi:hypothetical protein
MQPKPPQDSDLPSGRRRALRAGFAAAAVLAVPSGRAAAQSARNFPAGARLGRLELRVFPEAQLDGVAVRLGAGARIFDQRNMIVMPATMAGQHDVLVERDTAGDIGRVWIVSADELKAAQARERERSSSGPAGQRR